MSQQTDVLAYLKRLLGVLASFFPRLSMKPVKKNKPREKKQGQIRSNWVNGDYSNIKSLLSDLEYRHKWLAGYKPKRNDTGMRMMKKLGIYMVAPVDHGTVNIGSLDGGKSRKYPAAMAVAFSNSYDSSEPDNVGNSNILMWAQKYKWNHQHYNVSRPENGWFYEFGLLVYCNNIYTNHTVALEIVNGDVRLLRVKKAEKIPIGKSNTCAYYTRVDWGKCDHGPSYQMEKQGGYSKADLERHTIEQFCMLYNTHLRRDAGTQVHATKGGIRMVFTVPVHCWKDFFKERDVTALASDGKRKRIFHHVSAHQRANGQTVKMHTRGLTRFKWGSDGGEFNVRIVEQKKGRLSFMDFDIMPEASDQPSDGKSVEVDYVGDMALRSMTKDLHVPSS